MLKRCKRRHHKREQRCALRGCKEVSQFLSISNKSILTYIHQSAKPGSGCWFSGSQKSLILSISLYRLGLVFFWSRFCGSSIHRLEKVSVWPRLLGHNALESHRVSNRRQSGPRTLMNLDVAWTYGLHLPIIFDVLSETFLCV